MANSKPSRPNAKRSAIPIPAAARVPRTEPAQDLTARVEACEAEIDRTHAELAIVRGELSDLRDAIAKLAGRAPGSTGRKRPPPLPEESSNEVIAVDISEVTMESIRPRPPRIR